MCSFFISFGLSQWESLKVNRAGDGEAAQNSRAQWILFIQNNLGSDKKSQELSFCASHHN